MIAELVTAWERRKGVVAKTFTDKHPAQYIDIVRAVVRIMPGMDPERIHEIDDGDYQGTLVFLVAQKGYQPDKYWAVKVGYGSCSGCDTLQAIHDYSEAPPTEKQVKDYMQLALHIVQGFKEI